jgi:hypothetical protein
MTADAKPVSPVTNAQHTPGPWKAEIFNSGAFDIRPFGRDSFIIAGRNANEYRNAECVANARLIAAAPEMLAALKEARSIPLPPRITDLVYAAIARAEGRKP